MKLTTSLIIAASFCVQSTNAFVPNKVNAPKAHQCAISSNTSTLTTSNTSLNMGLFDYFSEEARKEREEQKRREIEEQEALQREIIERRRNPEMMEEYEAKVRVRRALRMSGKDDAAESVKMFTSVEEE